ncbi:nitrate- and nitrite sensing domain-containing protein [Sphaerisporangium flaviroseum]|uniref:histidine kinase n=1 Tax=Sphaerisporangium flaviroseum TaxID=509199 RepID=A0ABP7HBV1_9ACTN
MTSSRSVRFKISALLVIPLLSLGVLWAFGASVTLRESANLLNVASLYEDIGKPGDELAIALQREHVLSAELLGARSERAQSALVAQRHESDKLRDRLRRMALTDDAQAALSTPAMRARFEDMMARLDRLDSTRAAVDSGSIDLVTLTHAFSQFPDGMQKLVTSMSATNDVELYQQSHSLTAMAYSKDFLSRQRALAAGALIAGHPMSPGELRLFSELATTRRFLFDQALPELQPATREPFEKLVRSEAYRGFIAMEAQILYGDGRTISHAAWRSVADEVERSYQATLTKAGAALAASAEPAAIVTFVRAGLAGALGLLAVVASLIVAFRVGRGLTRELGELRAAATELATVRLPRVIERLRRGEDVDTDMEVPPLTVTATTTEVRDLSSAFDSVQRTAVETAVEQARLRDAVSKAFRNLARRSQSLLQRQLKLLDGMQRRVEEPETLRDLFRVDHLTTRMRRHAEGLVILSGDSPGRSFRQDVPVMDVVRAAIGEVEDYTRVRVHPMPDATIAGGAVADVIHLCAELVENATSFSPPHTEVTVRGELVARGFAVEVEDRGLGMSHEERDTINEKLSRPPEFDPVETERLGLFVIGRLAARHGIRVELRSSPYGGTAAIILIPEWLITAQAHVEPVAAHAGPAMPARYQGAGHALARRPASGGAPASGQDRLPRRVRQANLAPQLKQGTGVKASPAQAATETRAPADARALTETQAPTDTQATTETRAPTDTQATTETRAPTDTQATTETRAPTETQAVTDTRAVTGQPGPDARPPAGRSPEESRALLNSLQSGWRRGRADSERDGEEA